MDARGYLPSVDDNLRQPLSPPALRAFNIGSGSELKDTRHRPAKMKALHSSAALAVNVFDYWTTRNTGPLVASLGLQALIDSIAFEAQFSTNLDGNPPNLDLAIELSTGITVVIESKFSEWLTPKSRKRECFKPKYFPQSQALWEPKGLPACQSLAVDIHQGSERFRYLDAPQLLKHALGLATQLSDRFSLYYLYFDWPSSAADLHRTEMDHFANRVGEELRFRTLTYQELFHRLLASPVSLDAEYVDYLRARYFPQAA
ncbi:MAG: hypothetical protein HY713_05220 [candidate division NC10 bacterium]|nr:hypothetical protein [candidate division NC10 bacterium]